MKIIGLTGSIAAGKTTTAQLVTGYHIPLFDADQAVHTLLAQSLTVKDAIAHAFPEVIVNGKIERPLLAARVFNDDAALQHLMSLLHPHVFTLRDTFIKRARYARKKAVLLDIPLLFETGLDAMCDLVIVVSAPHFLRHQRALRRPHMTTERFKAVTSQQLPDHHKCRKATHVIKSGLGKAMVHRQIKELLQREGLL